MLDQPGDVHVWKIAAGAPTDALSLRHHNAGGTPAVHSSIDSAQTIVFSRNTLTPLSG
jgi:hypothetical protein